MKFAYVDETGPGKNNDIFVMVGVLVDAYKLRKCTKEFDDLLKQFFSETSTQSRIKELKTSEFINGRRTWGRIDPDKRKQFLNEICTHAKNNARAKIYASCISINTFNESQSDTHLQSYWQAAGMYIASLIQKKMMRESKNKGLTVLVFDDNKMDMPKVSNELYELNPWYDGLYQSRKKRKWKNLADGDRFNQIVNTAFAIKSEHSSFIQVADAVAYIYRRQTELQNGDQPKWEGEKEYYDNLASILDKEKLGVVPDNNECVEFYNKITPNNWEL